MKHMRWMKPAAVLLLLAATPAARTAPVPAEQSPLAWVPATAPVVIHVNGLHNLRDHVVAFLRTAAPQDADMVQKFTGDFFDKGIEGHKIRGVPKNGVILVALMDLNKINAEVPDVAVIAAVDDYKEFRDNLLNEKERSALKQEDGYESTVLEINNKTCFLVDKKDHVVFTLHKDRAAAFAKGGAGLDGRMSKPQAERFLRSDVGLYVSMDVFNKDYAEMVKGAREQMDEALKNAEQLPNRSMKPLVSMAKGAIGPLFQAVDDSKGVLYTLDVHPGGLVMHAETEVRPGTKTAALLQDFKPTAFQGLDKMPLGKIYYVGMQTVPPLFRLTGTMLFSSLNDATGKEAEAIDAAVSEMLKAGPSARLLAGTVPPAGVQIWKFDDPDKAMTAQAKLIEATGAGLAKGGVFRDKPEIKPHAQKYKDFDFTSVRVQWDLDRLLAAGGDAPKPPAEEQAAVKKLLGDGLSLWFGTDGKTFVQVTAPDWDAAAKQLDQYFKGDGTVAEDKAFAAARKEMPAEATVLMLIDVIRYAELLADAVKAGPGGAGGLNMPAALKGKSAYAGVSVTLQPERASLDVYVPAEAVQLLFQGFFPFFPWR